MCGKEHLSWKEIRFALRGALVAGVPCIPHDDSPRNAPPLTYFENLDRLWSLWKKNDHKLTLAHLYRDCSYALATDARDRIYGLLGLTGFLLDIVAGYDKSVEQVFTDVTKACLMELKSFEILSLVTLKAEHSLYALNSGVPDFSQRLGMQLFGIWDRCNPPKWLRLQGFNEKAKKHYWSDAQVSIDGDKLLTNAVIIGKICAQTGSLSNRTEGPPLGEWAVVRWCREALEMVHSYHPATARSFFKRRRSPKQGTPPESSTLEDKLMVTFVAGNMDPVSDCLDSFFSHFKVAYLQNPDCKDDFSAPQAWSYVHHSPELPKDCWVTPDTTWIYIGCIEMSCLESRTAVIEGINTTLGMVPILPALGDCVCVFPGARVPFVLRKRDDGTYRVIGECFVPDYMCGEAFAVKKLTRLTIP